MTRHQKVGTIGILMCAMLAFLIVQYDISLVLGAAILLGLLALIVAWPEAGTLTVVFVLYTNIAVIAKQFHGVPDLVASSFPLLLVAPLVNYIIFKREKLIIDWPFALMVVFLAVLLVSSLLARDLNIAIDWVISFFAEGLVLYLLMINSSVELGDRCETALRPVQ